MNQMTIELRHRYADYIAGLAREALSETGIKRFPEGTVLVVQHWSRLAELDDIIGWKILVTDHPSTYEFSLAFPSEENERNWHLLKAFMNAMDFIEMTEEPE